MSSHGKRNVPAIAGWQIKQELRKKRHARNFAKRGMIHSGIEQCSMQSISTLFLSLWRKEDTELLTLCLVSEEDCVAHNLC
mmetsp:Transcript_46897/g.99625  ORF Transcript_46897/g.99625 Transcript_46897/m.99625 type:complete len:81 (+) Transcript_46897:221-463(+)